MFFGRLCYCIIPLLSLYFIKKDIEIVTIVLKVFNIFILYILRSFWESKIIMNSIINFRVRLVKYREEVVLVESYHNKAVR